VETIINDLRYAIRNLRNARGFTFVAICTLALGIGAPTAMFSVINALILRPLPFRSPAQLVAVGEYNPAHGRVPEGSFSYPDFSDVAKRNHSLESIAVYNDDGHTMTGAGEARHVETENVSANLFTLLGVQPVLGRAFLPEEDRPGHHVLLLSNAFWRSHFNSDSGVTGRSVNLDGKAYTIVGVMPAGFQFPIRAEARDMWLTFSKKAEPDDPNDPKDTPTTGQRGNHSMTAIARLKPGETLAQANADLALIAAALQAEYPDTNTRLAIGARPEVEHLIGDTRQPLFILFGAVGLVLLIACANVANLLLGRSAARAREMAIRAALGASRTRIVRQLLTESVVLSFAGAAVGIVLAAWALSAVLELYPANLPRAQEIGVDFRVALFTAGLAVLTGLLFGLVPALRTSSPNLGGAMREGGRSTTAGPAQDHLRSGLVVAETALGVMLLIGAGLLLRSLDRLSHANLGIDPTHVLTASFDLSETRYNPDQQDRFVRDLMQRLNAIPGVVSASGAIPLPLHQDLWEVSFNQLDRPLPPRSQHGAGFYNVWPGLFETLKIPLIQGRTFNDRDARNGTPVMIVNQAFARKFYPGEDPIGKRVEIGAGEGPTRAQYKKREIIGVVGDIRTSNVTTPPGPAYYVPLPQLMWGAPTLVIRTAGDPAAIASEVREVMRSMDPDAPLYAVRTMEDYLALDLGRARFQTVLLALFAAIALLLTAIGLYGVIAYAVAQRLHEIGIRMALGASRSDVLQLVLGRGAMLTGVGILLGAGGAAALGRLIESLLFETPARDPLTYLTVCAVLGGVALLASYIPAMRATRVDPTVALRYE
jgi:putative ABC transport system permease protein